MNRGTPTRRWLPPRPSVDTPYPPAARWATLAGTLAIGLGAWAATGNPWPWLYAFGAGVALAVIGIRKQLGPAWTAAAALAVADLVWLASLPWWGLVLTLGLVAAAGGAVLVTTGRIPLRHRYTLLAAAISLALLLTGGAGGLLHALHRDQQQQHDLREAHEHAVDRMLPHDPGSMLQHWIVSIAEHQPDTLCWALTPAGRNQFARSHHAPNCAAAANRLSGKVTDPVDYQNSAWLPSSAVTYLHGRTSRLDACNLDLAGGPDSLGRLTLTPYRDHGLRVARYTPC